MRPRAAFALACLIASFVVGCSGSDDSDDEAVPATTLDGGAGPSARIDGAWYRPSVTDTWQWQLSGIINTSYDADVYDVDLFDVPQAVIDLLQTEGRHVICYFSAGSSEEWRVDDALFPETVRGEPLDGWEGERWLDVRAPEVLDVMLARLDLAAEKGCNGVEPDNVAGYDDTTGFDFTEDDQIAYNRAIADAAHERGLAVALKNAPDLIPALIDRYDFSVSEQCHEYDECEAYTAFVDAGKPVFNAEYDERFVDDESARQEMCDTSVSLGVHTLVLPLDLDDQYRFAC